MSARSVVVVRAMPASDPACPACLLAYDSAPEAVRAAIANMVIKVLENIFRFFIHHRLRKSRTRVVEVEHP